MSRNALAARFTAALLKRTAPHTGVTLKMLGNKAGCSDDTLANYRDDRTKIPADAIEAIDRALAAYGFPGFMAEVFGCPSGKDTPAAGSDCAGAPAD